MRADERVAQYFSLYSWLLSIIVLGWYRVVFKKFSFDIFGIIKTTKDKIIFAIENADKVRGY